MQINTKPVAPPVIRTAHGTIANRLTAEEQLHRTVVCCLLWEESSMYEHGENVSKRITDLVLQVRPEFAYTLAVRARTEYKLRHVPLWIICALAEGNADQRRYAGMALGEVIQRADELAEFCALYWKDTDRKRKPLAAGLKRALARAFRKFDEYQLAKYNRDKAIKLADVLRLVHPKPQDAAQAALWGRLRRDELAVPDTWETALSEGNDKLVTWVRLLNERKLPAMALLRNLRNMIQAKVPLPMIRQAITEMKTERVLPFRFITAARHAPTLEPELEAAMFRCLAGVEKLAGRTALVVDTSPSMREPLSARSEMNRLDAAAALAILCRELSEECDVYAFNMQGYVVPARRGFALRDALAQTIGGASFGNRGVKLANEAGYDRIIVLTDGQWHLEGDTYMPSGAAAKNILDALTSKAYLIQMDAIVNSVGTDRWTIINGWSESVLAFIQAHEVMLDPST